VWKSGTIEHSWFFAKCAATSRNAALFKGQRACSNRLSLVVKPSLYAFERNLTVLMFAYNERLLHRNVVLLLWSMSLRAESDEIALRTKLVAANISYNFHGVTV
jgi:hypothetical protein